MVKKNDISSIKDIGVGILDTLNGIKEDKNSKVLDEQSKNINNYESKGVNQESNNNPKGKKNNSEKEVKSKRSFMLTETTIQKLNLLKLCMENKDLSTIVDESVAMYFDKNKKSIESLIEVYNRLK
ncbi:hypothetical protein ACJDU8_24300 [Clostridium sp. WILCCON 0269]|uniref:CopG family transcriptional regulator n=1 Tax=Candidatus Clostridium eludens TaxID=3381663 RepID=A0ABW8SUM5_9CLOT